MSALSLRRRPTKRPRRCDWFGCDPLHRTVAQRRKAAFDVLILGRPAGIVCAVHAGELAAVWAGAHDQKLDTAAAA